MTDLTEVPLTFINEKTGVKVTAMQLPPEQDPASDALVEWLFSIEPHDDFFESGYDGSLIIHDGHAPQEVSPESWIIQHESKLISHLSKDIFSKIYSND